MLYVLFGVLFALSDEKGFVRAGVDVPVPKRIRYVEPVYPSKGRDVTPTLQGILILNIGLDEEGRPVDIKVVRRIPWLDVAAVEAAKQWRYEPTVVDGSARRVVVEEMLAMSPDKEHVARFWVGRLNDKTLEKHRRIEAAEWLSSARVTKKFVLEALQSAAQDTDAEISATAAQALQMVSKR